MGNNQMRSSLYKKISVILALLLAALLGLVALQPSEYRVERSAVIKSTPEAAFEQVNTLRNWDAWSPWAKVDPNAKISYSDAESGVGASFSWAGNNEVGEGKLTITDSLPAQQVTYDLEFVKPFAGISSAEFRFLTHEQGTKIIWSMWGSNSFFAKAIGLFIDCDKMIGDKFEEGLSNLRNVLEQQS